MYKECKSSQKYLIVTYFNKKYLSGIKNLPPEEAVTWQQN